MDRWAADLCQITVDATHETFDVRFDAPVFGHVLSAGNGDLYEHNTATNGRISVEQILEGTHPEVDAFRVVETVNSEDDRIRIT